MFTECLDLESSSASTLPALVHAASQLFLRDRYSNPDGLASIRFMNVTQGRLTGHEQA